MSGWYTLCTITLWWFLFSRCGCISACLTDMYSGVPVHVPGLPIGEQLTAQVYQQSLSRSVLLSLSTSSILFSAGYLLVCLTYFLCGTALFVHRVLFSFFSTFSLLSSLTSHLSRLSSLSPLTSRLSSLSPLTSLASHLSRLSSLSPLTSLASHLSRLSSLSPVLTAGTEELEPPVKRMKSEDIIGAYMYSTCTQYKLFTQN